MTLAAVNAQGAQVVPITAAKRGRPAKPKPAPEPMTALEQAAAAYKPPEEGAKWAAVKTRLICRRFADVKPREKAAHLIKATFLDYEGVCGSTLIRSTDERAWIWCEDRQKIMPIELRHRPFADWLAPKYGLLPGEAVSRAAVADIRAFTMEHGVLRAIRRFSYYDKAEHVLYLSRYDGTAYRLDGERIEVVPNGEGALFLDDEGGIPTEALIPVVSAGPPAELWDSLVNDLHFADKATSGMSRDAQRRLLMVWLLAVAFPDLMASKPILLTIGEQGAGKSAAIQRFQILAQGRDRVQTLTSGDEDDFGVSILREAVALLDNVDNPLKWLQDSLCSYATGGAWTRRRKYTDDETLIIQPHAFIAIATKNPATFRRDDLADRSILLELARRAGAVGGIALDALLGRVRENRPRLYGAWLWYLNRVVAELKTGNTADDAPIHHRMADFARFAHIAGRVLGFSWAEVEESLGAQTEARLQLVSDGDMVLEVMERWFDKAGNNRRTVNPAELFAELAQLALELHLPFLKNLRTLNDRLRHPDEGLKRFCIVERIEAPAGRHGGQMIYYRLTRRD